MKLKENNKAPNFKLTSTDGNIFELNKVKKKNIRQMILFLLLSGHFSN